VRTSRPPVDRDLRLPSAVLWHSALSAAHADGLQQWLVKNVIVNVVVTAVAWQRLVRLSGGCQWITTPWWPT
jgi:hypothetical protein